MGSRRDLDGRSDKRFDAPALISRLDHFDGVLRAVVGCFQGDDTRWRPDASSWSALEIVCHLADEEAEDFRTRTLMTLGSPGASWPPIDPEGWAGAREYRSRDLEAELDRFCRERRESVRLLRGLGQVDWSATHTHPKHGDFTAASMLASWAAHDALHLRQLAKRLHQLATRDLGELGGDGGTRYAGTW